MRLFMYVYTCIYIYIYMHDIIQHTSQNTVQCVCACSCRVFRSLFQVSFPGLSLAHIEEQRGARYFFVLPMCARVYRCICVCSRVCMCSDQNAICYGGAKRSLFFCFLPRMSEQVRLCMYLCEWSPRVQSYVGTIM